MSQKNHVGIVTSLPTEAKRGSIGAKNGHPEHYLLEMADSAGLAVGSEVTFDARESLDYRDVVTARNVRPTGRQCDVRRSRGVYLWSKPQKAEIDDASGVSYGVPTLGVVCSLGGSGYTQASGWVELKDGRKAYFNDTGLPPHERQRFAVGDEVELTVQPCGIPARTSKSQRASYEEGGSRFHLIATEVTGTGMVAIAGRRVPRSDVATDGAGSYVLKARR